MRVANLIPNKQIHYSQNLRDVVWRGFDGGWNVLDDDMNLSYKYATRMENCYPDNDGSVKIRQGFKLFAACASYFSTAATILDVFYFNGSLIVVGSNGEVLKILANTSVSRIWDTVVAAALPNNPTGWSPCTFVSAAIFNGHLIICNGQDKPIDIDSEFVVEYLQDLGTNTNINVPICKYVVTLGRYLVMAGDPLELDRVHISAKDAAGTFYGDPPPNDATRLDVGSIIPAASVIRGLLPFRGKLVTMFAEGLVIGTLGVYDNTGNHTPSFEDGIEGFGSISHRAGIAYGDDGLFMDLQGVPSIKRTVLSSSFKPERVSELIDIEIKKMLTTLSFESMEDRVFSVYNKADGQFMLFVPNAETIAGTTETVAFVYNYRPSLHQQSWARYRNLNFTCGTRSLGGRIFFGDSNGNIWLYGTRDDKVSQDYTVNGVGVNIAFDWEMPWFDLGSRLKTKTSKYLSFDTRGASEFLVRMYVDNNLTAPALQMAFSGGEQGEFGSMDQPFGGGRNTSRKKHFGWPTKFEIGKIRISGTADAQLSFVSVALQYLGGGYNR